MLGLDVTLTKNACMYECQVVKNYMVNFAGLMT